MHKSRPINGPMLWEETGLKMIQLLRTARHEALFFFFVVLVIAFFKRNCLWKSALHCFEHLCHLWALTIYSSFTTRIQYSATCLGLYWRISPAVSSSQEGIDLSNSVFSLQKKMHQNSEKNQCFTHQIPKTQFSCWNLFSPHLTEKNKVQMPLET